jgi:anti-sigma regulatory factor (Ser/Thr protein kinase)/biotin operon repressor
MSVSNPKGAIRQALLSSIDDGDPSPAASVARQFSVTRQAVNRHLRELVDQGLLSAKGTTRSRRYALVETSESKTYDRQGLSEDAVWREFVAPQLDDLPDNLKKLWHHGVTEMVNNSIDHSEGTVVDVTVDRNAVTTRVGILDNGVGIFRKIKEAAHLEDERLAALELAKGKFTTDPANHSGEGIFFTCRMFDKFSILSHCLFFLHAPTNDDWLLEDDKDQGPGTLVAMTCRNTSHRTLSQVYERFASSNDDFRFSMTHIPVGLARIGKENLVSRSQAKRVLNRLERFDKVLLDFAGVDSIGQGFADEAFRVFPLSNPDTRISWMNAAPEVERMIRRAVSARESSQALTTQPGLFDSTKADEE